MAQSISKFDSICIQLAALNSVLGSAECISILQQVNGIVPSKDQTQSNTLHNPIRKLIKTGILKPDIRNNYLVDQSVLSDLNATALAYFTEIAAFGEKGGKSEKD